MKKIAFVFLICINALITYGQPITLTDGSASLTLAPDITGTGCGPNAGFDPGNGIDQLFALDWYMSIEGGPSINFPPATNITTENDNTVVAQYDLNDVFGYGNLNATLTVAISELSPFDVQVTQVMEINESGSFVDGGVDVKLYSYIDLDKNDERTEDATIYLKDECNFITEIRNTDDPSQVCYYAVNASDGYQILPAPNLCQNLLDGISDLSNSGLPLNAGDYTQAVQFNTTIPFFGFRTCETILTFGNPPEPAIVDERSGQCTFTTTPDPNFTYAQPIQICNEDGSFMLKIDISHSYYSVQTDWVFVETNIPGIPTVFASYYYYEGEVFIGPYPAGSSWNIEVYLYDNTGPLLTTYTGTSTDCSQVVDCSTLSADLQATCEAIPDSNDIGYITTLTISGGDGNYTITGDVNEEGDSFIDPATITDSSIDVTIEDGNGCVVEVSEPVEDCPPAPDCSTLSAVLSVDCITTDGPPFVYLYATFLTITGGDGNYNITGDVNNAGVDNIDPATITDGSIDVTIEDGNGCIVEISEPVSACPETPETCPASTDLGVFDCTNIDDVPSPPTNIEEAMALPYNIQFTGATELTRVTTIDSDPIFYCEDNARIVTRTVIIYQDNNLNCSYDPGEELASCEYEIFTVPDISAPVFTAPSTTGTTCALGWDPSVTGVVIADDACPLCTEFEVAYSDSLIPAELVIVRTWSAVDYCGNLFEQEQLIFIDDAENCIDSLNSLVTNSPAAPCSILDVNLQVSCESFPCEENPNAASIFGYAVEFTISPCFGDYSITGDLNQSVAGGFEPIIITEFIDPSSITDGSIDVRVEDRNGCVQEVSEPVSNCPPADCSTLTANLDATCVITPLISGEFIPEYEVILSISGGDGNYAISGDVNQAGESVILATTITDGSIDVIIEDGNGCIVQVSEPVSDCPEIDCSTLSADLQVTCSGDFTEYKAMLAVNGGDGNYSISGDVSSIGQSSIDPSTVTDSSIDVVVEDGNGCKVEASSATPECESPPLECGGVQAVSTKTTNMDKYIKHLNRWSKYLEKDDVPNEKPNKD